jgi:hypothetical protein
MVPACIIYSKIVIQNCVFSKGMRYCYYRMVGYQNEENNN